MKWENTSTCKLFKDNDHASFAAVFNLFYTIDYLHIIDHRSWNYSWMDDLDYCGAIEVKK